MTAQTNISANPATKHLDYLDGWRGIAICLLLLGHFCPIPGINLGAVGVNLFFVLSGLLMTRLLFIQQTPIGSFYRRRISRIVPAHVAFITLVVVSFALTGRDVSGPETIAAALFVNNYVGSSPGHSIMPYGHIWSLSVEEHSYVVLSALAVLARTGLITATAGLGVLSLACALCAVGYGWFSPSPQLQFDQWLHTEVAGYGIFISGFILLLLRGTRPRKWPSIAVPLLTLCGLALHWWSVPLAIQKVFGVGALALAVNLLPSAPPAVQTILAWRPLRYMGLWSFSIYIWQQPFYLWSRDGDTSTWIGFLLALAAGLVSFYGLEQPARRYLNRTWGVSRGSISTKT
jgi:peptidoglycan/LPS O-acetylase OafA/YrhL